MSVSEPRIISPDDPSLLASRAREGLPGGDHLAYLSDFLTLGPRVLAGARDLRRFVVALDDHLIPVVVNDGSEDTCYILSPHAHYVRYAQFEIRKMPGSAAAIALSSALGILGRVSLPLGFNRCVSINNWLFTTNPTLRLAPRALARLTALLVDRFPDHPLVIRTVDARDDATRRMFVEAGYRLVVNRPVHEWDPARLTRKHRANVRADLRLLRDGGHVVSRPAVLGPGDEHRIAELYQGLYLGKHSLFNVRYSPQFFRSVVEARIMRLTTISAGGRIQAFATCLDDGDRIVGALVGYDTALDRRRHPLYRMALATMFEEASRRGRVLFLSTGAATFKSCRGTREWLEHEAVYDRHLAWPRRAPWAAFEAALRVGVGQLDTSRM